MSRVEDSNEFYELLDELQQRVGCCRRLSDCTAKSGWPTRSVLLLRGWRIPGRTENLKSSGGRGPRDNGYFQHHSLESPTHSPGDMPILKDQW